MNETTSIFEVIRNNAGHFAALVILILVAFAITTFAERKAMAREQEQTGHAEKLFSIRKITIIGVFSAISFVLMLLEFPLPFAPSFYKFDFSDVPALIGGFAAGPMVAVMIEFIKVLLNIVLQGTTSGFVGEIANFVVGAAFVVPATIIYRFKKTRKVALISCLTGTVCITLVGALLNAYFLLPAYAVMFGSGVDAFVAMGSAINPAVSNVFTFCALCVAPFNLVKGVADSAITFLVYKQLSPILKADGFKGVAKKTAEA
ncbi:MAG: ECF transporter S component [Butyrivibrio sp.]|nr:ECF transporter S component [Butyrivibrio sp.]